MDETRRCPGPTIFTDSTSLLVRRALSGDDSALNEMVEKLTPLLRMQARSRLRGRFGPATEEDLVQEAWRVFLTMDDSFDPGEVNATRRLLSYLARAVLFNANNFLRTEGLRRARADRDLRTSSQGNPLDRLSSPVVEAMKEAERSEWAGMIKNAFSGLRDEDRGVIVLRGIEGLDNAQVGRELGLSPNAVAQRYRRALQRLRESLPRGMVAELFPKE